MTRSYLIVMAFMFTLPMLPAYSASSKCGDATSQTSISQCVIVEMKTADAALTYVYKALMAKLSASEKQKLRVAERAWIDYRDKMCDFAGLSREGGSMQGMVVAMCRTEMITEQTRKLTWQLTCRESGEDCSHF